MFQSVLMLLLRCERLNEIVHASLCTLCYCIFQRRATVKVAIHLVAGGNRNQPTMAWQVQILLNRSASSRWLLSYSLMALASSAARSRPGVQCNTTGRFTNMAVLVMNNTLRELTSTPAPPETHTHTQHNQKLKTRRGLI